MEGKIIDFLPQEMLQYADIKTFKIEAPTSVEDEPFVYIFVRDIRGWRKTLKCRILLGEGIT